MSARSVCFTPLTDDRENYEYVYDVWGRLRFVVNRDTSDTVAEYTYNGLGHRTGWHSDVTDDSGGGPDGEVDDYDPWYHFVYDDRWRVIAVYRAFHDPDPEEWAIDAAAKERFVYHNAGLDEYGGSSSTYGVGKAAARIRTGDLWFTKPLLYH